MIRDSGDLPDDVTTLQALLLAERAGTAKVSEELAAIRAETANYKAQIEHLKAQLAKLRRSQFGKSSEKLDQQIAKLELVSRIWRRAPLRTRRRTQRPKRLRQTATGRR